MNNDNNYHAEETRMKLKCKCGYEWESKSKLILVSCPSCGKKVKRPEDVILN